LKRLYLNSISFFTSGEPFDVLQRSTNLFGIVTVMSMA
jgi:hypothetical protein